MKGPIETSYEVLQDEVILRGDGVPLAVGDVVGLRELAAGAEVLCDRAPEAPVGRIEDEPKSRAWRMRSKIGDRKRWYELPEEVA